MTLINRAVKKMTRPLNRKSRVVMRIAVNMKVCREWLSTMKQRREVLMNSD